MGLIINTNVASMIAKRNLRLNTRSVADSMEKLSTGYKINHAKDDVAGMQISEILRTQIRGYNKAIQNAQDGASMLQVGEGAFESITENIQRIRELTVQAANDTYGSNERRAIAREVSQRLDDIDRVANSTQFNGVSLLNGSQSSFILQIGPNAVANVDTLQLSQALQTATASALDQQFADRSLITADTGTANARFGSGGFARAYLAEIDTALNEMFNRRSEIGALQNRLDSVITSLEVASENLSASDSRIRDLDIAEETSRLTRNQVLQQASASVLAQANQIPALALNLL